MKHWNYNNEFEEKYKYQGDDLGAVYTPEKTTFRNIREMISVRSIHRRRRPFVYGHQRQRR